MNEMRRLIAVGSNLSERDRMMRARASLGEMTRELQMLETCIATSFANGNDDPMHNVIQRCIRNIKLAQSSATVVLG